MQIHSMKLGFNVHSMNISNNNPDLFLREGKNVFRLNCTNSTLRASCKKYFTIVYRIQQRTDVVELDEILQSMQNSKKDLDHFIIRCQTILVLLDQILHLMQIAKKYSKPFCMQSKTSVV